MANRREGRPSIVQWDRMRKIWTRNSGNSSAVQSYFSAFLRTHKNYEFTVAKVYYGLYEFGITCEQYDAIKFELQSQGRGSILPGINCTELIRENGDVRKKSFRNEREQQAYQVSFVQRNNSRMVKEKRKEVEDHFKKAEECLKKPGEKLLVSFDLEVYEYDKDKVLEIGYTVVRLLQESTDGSVAPEITEKCHLIIEENLELKNKDFVADNRDGFRFGTSETVTMVKAVEKFREAVEKCTFLVAHASGNDAAYLKSIGLDLAEFRKEIMDTQLIEQHKEFQCSAGERLFLRNLGKMLQSYNVRHEEKDLHNAGCDAYFTMKVFLRQMGHGIGVVNSLS